MLPSGFFIDSCIFLLSLKKYLNPQQHQDVESEKAMGKILIKNVFMGMLILLLFCGCNELLPGEVDNCLDTECGENANCDEQTGQCICDPGYELFGKGCVLKQTNSIDGDSESDNKIDLCAGVTCDNPGPCELSIECNPDTGKCETEFAEEGTSCSDDLFCNGEETCDAEGVCLLAEAIECGENMYCDEDLKACACNSGYELSGENCVQLDCLQDSDCDDGFICNGLETCNPDNKCETGEAVVCMNNATCKEPEGICTCNNGFKKEDGECIELPTCPVPQAATMSIIHLSATLSFSVADDLPVTIGTSKDLSATEPDEWQKQTELTLFETGKIKVFAKVDSSACNSENIFEFVYDVHESYPPAAGTENSTAISKDDPQFSGWATGYITPVNYGSEVFEVWQTPDKALGEALGNAMDVVSLGRGGEIILTFDPSIKNGDSYDFAVFENGLSPEFLELAYVEVSSDGVNFFRFDNAYLSDQPVPAFGASNPENIGSLAGKYQAGFGTPFDLDVFKNRNEVYEGILNLDNIAYVKIIDIVGGTSDTDTTVYYDSFGNIIYDPYPTIESAGFDLEAVGVINH